MIKIKDMSECCGCHACFNSCPAKAIKMKINEKGFLYPKVDENKCIQCGLCEKVCPMKKHKKVNENPIKTYACWNNDEKIRMQSSSGGIFTLLAKEIINDGGVVIGAKFNGNFEVIHTCAETIEQLEEIRGSKYVQSSVGTTYQDVKEFLKEERKVLFTGTPCQIEGLKMFLGEKCKQDGLYTQDIVCHGVPSPKVWQVYLSYIREKMQEDIEKINFRDKTKKGWTQYEIMISGKQKVESTNVQNNLFMQAFLRNTCLRDSCYQCKFKKLRKESDITLGDFWGVDQVAPEMYDNKGTSLVIINTKKGEQLFEEILNQINYKEVAIKDAIKYNPSIVIPSKMDKKQNQFYENLDKVSFEKLVKKYTHKSNRIVQKFERLLKKCEEKKR